MIQIYFAQDGFFVTFSPHQQQQETELGIFKLKFKNIVKFSVLKSTFDYLLERKDTQKTAKSLKYYNLKMEDYLMSGSCNTRVSKIETYFQ